MQPGKEDIWQVQIVTAVRIMCTMKNMNVIVVWSIWMRTKCIVFSPAASGNVLITVRMMSTRWCDTRCKGVQIMVREWKKDVSDVKYCRENQETLSNCAGYSMVKME